MLNLRVASKTDRGRRRHSNEDRLLVARDGHLLVVCDGAGGHNAGEVASDVAVLTIAGFQRPGSEGLLNAAGPADRQLGHAARRLVAAIRLANLSVFTWGESSKTYPGVVTAAAARSWLGRVLAALLCRKPYRGMMTTVTAMEFDDDGAFCTASVGDSRIYRLREGTLQQLTRDNTLGELRRARNQAAGEDAHVLDRALGQLPTVDVGVRQDTALAGDVYLLCSDGLYGELDNSGGLLSQLLERHKEDPQQLCDTLIDEANARDGSDNISAVVVRVEKSPQDHASAPSELDVKDDARVNRKRRAALRKALRDTPTPCKWWTPVAVAAALGLLSAVIVSALLSSAQRRPTYATVEVVLTPPELSSDSAVRVTLDGESVGFRIASVRTDTPHALIVEHPGYERSGGINISLARGETEKRVYVHLKPGVHVEAGLEDATRGGEVVVMSRGVVVHRESIAAQKPTVEFDIVSGTYEFAASWGLRGKFESTATVARGDSIKMWPDAWRPFRHVPRR
jgi:protein phosphatase